MLSAPLRSPREISAISAPPAIDVDLWSSGRASLREIQEAFPEPRPAYTTITTTVYRMEAKKMVRRVRKILSFFGGRAQPMMAELADAGKLTLDDVRELEKAVQEAERKRKAERARKK